MIVAVCRADTLVSTDLVRVYLGDAATFVPADELSLDPAMVVARAPRSGELA